MMIRKISIIRHATSQILRSLNNNSFSTISISISSRCRFQSQCNHLFISNATFSSTKNDEEKKGSGGIRGWMDNRAARQEKEKFMEQLKRLSTMEVFTMDKYRKELQIGLDGGGMMWNAAPAELVAIVATGITMPHLNAVRKGIHTLQ